MLYRPKAYKHPVLAFFSADYLPGPRFDCEFEIAEDRLSLEVRFLLENDYLNELIADGKALFGIEALCTETISRKFYSFETHQGRIDLNDMDLFGHVEFAPLLVATIGIDDFTPEFKNPEYTQRVFMVRKGEPLAIGAIFEAEIQRDHRRTEAPFEIEAKAGKPPHWFDLDTEQNSLKLFVSEQIGQAIQAVERDPKRSPLLYQGIYLSTVAAAIKKLQQKVREGDSSQLWVRRLLATLDDHGIDVFQDPTIVASELLYNRGWKKVLDQQEAQD